MRKIDKRTYSKSGEKEKRECTVPYLKLPPRLFLKRKSGSLDEDVRSGINEDKEQQGRRKRAWEGGGGERSGERE